MTIEMKNVNKSYDNKYILKDFNHTFKKGETTFVTGESGIGKTTLIRMLLGLENEDSGEIKGADGLKKSAVFQDDCLCENLSIYLNIKLVCDDISKEKLKAELEKIGLKDLQDRRVRELSGGMKRRVAILRALCSEFDLLILDEPFKGLDHQNKEKVMDYILKKTENKTLIIVTHDREEEKYFSLRRKCKYINL